MTLLENPALYMETNLKISSDSVVTMAYTLADDTGTILEQSTEQEPMAYLHGHQGLFPDLEAVLEGKSAGDKVSTTLPPEKTYGPVRDNLFQRVPIKHLKGAKKWKPGMIASVETDRGVRQVTVTKVGHTMATVDTNHPLAGKTLKFDLQVLDVRPASDEELAHGHAHGPGGHHH